jgi:putative membrane protein
MRDFVLRILINAIAIAVTAVLLDGITLANDSLGTLLIIGLVFSLVNAVLRPIITLLSCPLVILTLGLFILVINGVMLLITDSLTGGLLTVDGFWTAVFGGIIIALVNMVLEGLLGLDDEPPAEKEKR